MSTLLYVTAHPGNPETSYSLSAGEQFVQAYRESHPQDEVVHVDLYQRNIPHIDADVLDAWGKLQTGGTFNQLTEIQQQKVTQLNELLEEFVVRRQICFCDTHVELFLSSRNESLYRFLLCQSQNIQIYRKRSSWPATKQKSVPHSGKWRSILIRSCSGS